MLRYSKSVLMSFVVLASCLSGGAPAEAQGLLEEISSGFADLDRARLEVMGAEEPPHIELIDTSGLFFTNKTNEPIYVCAIYFERGNGVETLTGWYVQGWWKLGAGKTIRVLSSIEDKNIYYYAESGTHFWEGDKTEFVTNTKFRYRAPLNNKGGYFTKGFRQVDTKGADRYTLSFTPAR